MMTFDEMNTAVAERMHHGEAAPLDGLVLAELTAWEGLCWLYSLYQLGRYDKAMCQAIKEQMRHEYDVVRLRFEAMDRDLNVGIALLHLARKNTSADVRRLLKQAEGGPA